MTDNELLRTYVSSRSESAFSELVNRHLPLVWSAARRQMRDEHLAQDVTQQVFTLLAQKAPQLDPAIILPGWLHRATSHMAARTQRGESRRRQREHAAVALMNEPAQDPEWMEVEPLLDEAINDLADLDRDAVVLRYFKNQSLREVGAALGSSEDAVQKRLSRAVEKLHAFFASRGKTVSTGAILTGLAGCAAQAVPSGMATCISGSVLSNIILSASTTSTSTLASFHFISAVAMKPILITCAALAMSAVIVLQHHHAGQLKMQNEALLSRANDAESAAALPVGVGRVLPAVPENAPREAELLRLRGEVARLRAVEAELARRQELDRQQEAEARKQAAAAAETKLRFDVQRISTVDAFKQIGLQLRILVNDQKAEEAFQSDGILKANLIAKTHPDFDLGNVELLVKDAELLRELVDKDPQAIITRTRDPIPTPDGRWLRIYGNADGSAVQFTLDYPSQAFTDNWRLEAVKTRKQ